MLFRSDAAELGALTGKLSEVTVDDREAAQDVNGDLEANDKCFKEDIAVSYTHLDVYKRQIMPLMTWATHVLQWRPQREANS